MPDSPSFPSREAYARTMGDVAVWRSYVEAALSQQRLPCGTIRPGVPGTNVVFIVDDRLVVKLFPRIFGGEQAQQRELAVYGLLAHRPRLAVPALTGSGVLSPGEKWSWPYLVTTLVPGESCAEAGQRLSGTDWLAAARFCGGFLHAMHQLAAPGDDFDGFLAGQRRGCLMRHGEWGTLPAHLLDGLESFLDAALALPGRTHALLHGDLTADHLLGESAGGAWQPRGVIDFGDARSGDPYYELPALHLDLFGGDKRLLAAFLESYGWTPPPGFAQRAMAMTLLHEFDVLAAYRARIVDMATLEELAERLWNPEAAGLRPSR